MLETSVNVKALMVILLYYLLLEGVIIGYSTGQRAYSGELPPPQIILFAGFAVLYPILTTLSLKRVKWGFIVTMVLAVLAVITQTPSMLPWLGRMSIWWVATWILLYVLPALIILFSYKSYIEAK